MSRVRKTVENIYRKLWLLIWFAKLLGMLPWTKNGEKITRDGIFGRIYTAIFFAFCSCCFLPSIYEILTATVARQPAAIFRELLYTTATTEILLNLHREITDPSSGIRVIEALGHYDRRVELLGRGRQDSFAFSWIIAAPVIIIHVITVIMAIDNQYDDIVAIIFRRYLVTGVYIAILKFCIMTNLLYQRYRHLNDSVVPIATENSFDRPTVTIHDVLHLHATLDRATRTLATAYSGQILCWCSGFVNSMLQIVRYSIQLREFGECAARLVYILVQLITICWTCHRTAFQANKFGSTLLKTSQKFKRSFNSAVAIDAAIYVHDHRVTFTAGNFCDVNLTTVLTLSQITLNFALLVFG